jgi:Mce-associated membrane protein
MAVDADAAELTLDRSVCEPACEGEDVTEQSHPANTKGDSRTASGKTLAACIAIVAVLAGLTGWLGYRHYQLHRVQQRHDLFVHTEAGAAVARILDSATGQFRDDFQRRSQPFIELVTKMQSTSVGTIIDAGVQSEQDNEAQVLVAVNVNTSLAGTPEPQPRAWRMRITVQKAGSGAKVSNVEFVP